MNQGKVDMATLCLTALSGKAGNVITIALTKCLKKQKKAEDKVGSVKETDTRGMLSPLENVYPPLPSSYQYPSPGASDLYGFPGYGQYSGVPIGIDVLNAANVAIIWYR